MQVYEHAFPHPAVDRHPGILDSLRRVAGAVTRKLPANPILAVAHEMDRLSAAMTDEERRTVSADAIARRLRGRAYRVAVSGLIGGVGKIGSL